MLGKFSFCSSFRSRSFSRHLLPRNPFLLTNFLMLIFIAACSSGTNNGSGPDFSQEPAPDSPLLGSWEGAGCEISAGSSRNNFLTFNPDGTVELTFRNFARTNCSSLAYTDTAFAVFSEGEERELSDGRTIRELDFARLAGRLVTPTSADSVQSFNLTATCGFTDWQINVSREVQTCPTGLLEVDAQLFDVAQIYNITDDYFLSFGNELIFSAEQRPTQLTPIPSHVRQLEAEEGFPADVLGFWRVSGTSFFYELRSNTILVEYLPSETQTDCFNVTVSATRALPNNEYSAPGTQSIMILPTQNGITFVTSAGNTLLEPAAPVLPVDLIPCASLPGG